MLKNNSFWQKFSKTYDLINILVPYKDHLRDMIILLNPQKGGRYLDAGCGTGTLTSELYRYQRDIKIVGIDFSSRMLNKARQNNPNGDIKFVLADLNKPLEFPDNYFEGVISNHLLPYLKEPRNTIQEFHRVLKPRGKLIISTIKKDFRPSKIFKAHLEKVGLMGILNLPISFIIFGIFNLTISKGVKHEAVNIFTQESLLGLIRESGFRDVQIFDSYVKQDLIAVANY